MPTRAFLVLLVFAASPAVAAESRFECKAQGGETYRPYYLRAIPGTEEFEDFSRKPKGLLGQNPMHSEGECRRAVLAADAVHGVICSRTGLDGYKPTLYTGTVPGRPDFGYLGGSTIASFDDCLRATAGASDRGVCFWGGSDWWISPIDHEGVQGGPFATLDACLDETVPPEDLPLGLESAVAPSP